jgi:hypothetical protein
MHRRDFLLGLSSALVVLPYEPKTIYSFHNAPSIVEPNELFEIDILHVGGFTQKTLEAAKQLVHERLTSWPYQKGSSDCSSYQARVVENRLLFDNDGIRTLGGPTTVRVAIPKRLVPPEVQERTYSAIGQDDHLTRMKRLCFTRANRPIPKDTLKFYRHCALRAPIGLSQKIL